MSVTGFTPPSANTPSTHTSSGPPEPALPRVKTPCLAAGSCATNQFEHTSSAELVHRLSTGSPPSAEAASEASPAVSSSVSPAKSDGTLRRAEGSPVAALGGQHSKEDTQLAALKVEAPDTAGPTCVPEIGLQPVAASGEYFTVSDLSQGPVLHSSASKAGEDGGNNNKDSGGDGHARGQSVPGEAGD